MVKRYGIGTVAAVAATVVIWSTTFTALVVALRHFSPEHLLVVRWMLTSLFFVVIALFTRMRMPARADLPQIVIAGVLGIGAYQLLLVTGQTGVSASMAGFLVNLVPVFTTVIAVGLRRESSTWATWAGIAVCTAGLVVMGNAAGGFGRIGLSAGLVMAGALCFALYTLVTKPLLARYKPLEVTAYSTVAGSLPFLVFAPGATGAVLTAPPEALVTVAVLALFHGGIASIFWVRAVNGMTPGVASRFLYLIPVIGVGVAWLWIAEKPGLATLAGGVITVAGVALSNMRPRRLPARAHLATDSAGASGLPLPDAA